MIIRVSNKDREILKDLSKYIWWQDSEYAINHNTLRLIASAMCLANNVEDFIKVISLDKELLKEALKQAQPGWFDARKRKKEIQKSLERLNEKYKNSKTA